jgi:hypothetical protein
MTAHVTIHSAEFADLIGRVAETRRKLRRSSRFADCGPAERAIPVEAAPPAPPTQVRDLYLAWDRSLL